MFTRKERFYSSPECFITFKYFKIKIVIMYFFSLFSSETQKFLCRLYFILFCSVGYLLYLFFNLDLCINAWDRVLFINGAERERESERARERERERERLI